MNQDMEALKKAQEEWEQKTVTPLLAKQPESQPAFFTSSGIEMKRLYSPRDGSGEPYLEKLGFPGRHPFTRGVQPTMFRGRLWTMRQYAGFGSAAETNARFRYLLEQGQTGLSVAFDLPTQMGYDPDHAMSRGEVGKVGVSIASLGDMRRLFDRIPLDQVSVSMTINATAAVLLGMLIVVAEEQGVPAEKLRGTIQNDVLKEYVARGAYIFPPRPSLRVTTDIFAFCKEKLPEFNTISISGYHIREAGSTAAQEIAFTLADGIAYVEAAVSAGLKVDDFAGRLSFFFGCHNNFLEEVAKFRAARRLWARILKDRFGARSERSCALRFHTQTCGVTLLAQQPENNVVRVALQALAAVLGGTQSLHTNSRDEALSLPTEESVKIALRTQQVIAHESGVTDSVDPLGGSWAIEALTDELEKKAEELIGRIDELGGAVRAIEEGFMQRAIGDASYEYQQRVEKGEQVLVGLNRFQEEGRPAYRILRVPEELAQEAGARLLELKKSRDRQRAAVALEAVRRAAAENQNLMPPITEAVRSLCTVGEICDTLRAVFGEYREK